MRRNHSARRKRKLLLHREEIDKLASKSQETGHTIVPLAVYFKDGRAKAEIALARGKKEYDKRQTLREKPDRPRGSSGPSQADQAPPRSGAEPGCAGNRPACGRVGHVRWHLHRSTVQETEKSTWRMIGFDSGCRSSGKRVEEAAMIA
ncbi:SsrA-binding protein [Streptomyces fumanus]